MSVPLKNKLSYIWAKVCGEDRLYSRVFRDTDTYEVTRMNNIHIFFPGAASQANIPMTYETTESVRYSTWLEARPAPGETNKYFIYQHEHGGGKNEVYRGEEPLSRENAISMIARQERDWKKQGARQEYRQPFSAKLAIR